SGGLVILVVALLAGVFAPVIAPHGYDDQDLAFMLQPPVAAGGTWSNALGTDPLGRDVLSRIVYGARTSLLLALCAVLFAIAFMALLGPTVLNLVIVLVLRSWVVYAQLVRVAVLSVKAREFITVAV